VDRWITQALGSALGAAERPLIVDLGFGASPVTTLELYQRIRAIAPEAEVTGLEIDPDRVASARRDLAARRAEGHELPLRQRWLAAVGALSADWPVLRYPPYGGRRRWRLGEVTLPWAARAPGAPSVY